MRTDVAKCIMVQNAESLILVELFGDPVVQAINQDASLCCELNLFQYLGQPLCNRPIAFQYY